MTADDSKLQHTTVSKKDMGYLYNYFVKINVGELRGIHEGSWGWTERDLALTCTLSPTLQAYGNKNVYMPKSK